MINSLVLDKYKKLAENADFLFHYTLSTNVDSIKKLGLVPSKVDGLMKLDGLTRETDYTNEYVFFSTVKLTPMDFHFLIVDKKYIHKFSEVVKLDLSEYEWELDPEFFEGPEPYDCIRVKGIITKDKIIKINKL